MSSNPVAACGVIVFVDPALTAVKYLPGERSTARVQIMFCCERVVPGRSFLRFFLRF